VIVRIIVRRLIENKEVDMSNSFGYLKLMIQRANLFSKISGSIHVDIMVCNESIVQRGSNHPIPRLQIVRKTEEISGPEPIWNDYMEMRCCMGWDVKLEVVVNGENRYTVDNLVVGTCTSGEYYIRDVCLTT
jgi:hypothetical protein